MGIVLSPKQRWSIHRSDKRINIWVGAVRSSKTWATLFRWITYVASAPKGDLLLIGKTNRSLYRNIIRPLEDFLGNAVHYSAGKGELDIFDKKIFVVGAADERAEGVIRGMTCAGALGDEVTLWPESVFNMLLSRMSVTGAKFFGTTNTDNPNHWLKKGFLNRQQELDLIVFNFMLEDNPFLAREFVRNLRKEYTGLWYRRFILALWCIAEGAIYDFFEEKEPYLIKKFPQAKYKVGGIDIATDINPKRLKIAENLGAGLTINAAEENVVERLLAENGKPVDAVILCASAMSAVDGKCSKQSPPSQSHTASHWR